ncbi:MAG: hypothetical protein SFV18_12780 [Bryobacteraceae bacterium]|nr:hypothetical protein [Bryobacteraceae bacterium]
MRELGLGAAIGLALATLVALAGHVAIGWRWWESEPRSLVWPIAPLFEELALRGPAFFWGVRRYGTRAAQTASIGASAAIYLAMGWSLSGIVAGPAIGAWIFTILALGRESMWTPLAAHWAFTFAMDNGPAIARRLVD